MRLSQVKETCCVDCAGEKLAFHLCCPDCRDELAALERGRVMGEGSVPAACSKEIIAAPARGSVVAFREQRWLPKGDDFELVDAPYRAGCPGRVRDVFDVMTEQAARRGGAAPYTAAQVGAGRDYRDLHERLQSSGMKCSSAFGDRVGGKGRVDFMDAYIRDRERLVLFHDAIGAGIAKSVKRRAAAHVGGVKVGEVQLRAIGRQLITARRLVDDVCIRDRPLSAVLEAHGWRATGKNRMTLHRALCAILTRMHGI